MMDREQLLGTSIPADIKGIRYSYKIKIKPAGPSQLFLKDVYGILSASRGVHKLIICQYAYVA